jgi:hypothetical protein
VSCICKVLLHCVSRLRSSPLRAPLPLARWEPTRAQFYVAALESIPPTSPPIAMPKGGAQSPRSTPLSSTTPQTDNDKHRDSSPLWDTSLVSRPRYFDQLIRWLPTQDSRFTTLVQYGAVNDKRYTVVTSTNHMDRHRLGKIARGTFKQPCMIQHTDTDTTGFPADHEDTRADDESKYSVNHNIIDQVDNELLEKILGTIDDEDTIHELREESDGSGRALLRAFEQDVANAAKDDSGNLGENTRKDIESLLSAGLADTSVRSFNAFKSELSRLIRTLPDDLKAGYPSLRQVERSSAGRSFHRSGSQGR